MSTPPQPRRSSSESNKKLPTPQSAVVTRNGARKAKIQTRAMAAGGKASSSVIAAKRNAQHKKKPNIDIVIKDQYQSVMDSQHIICGATGVVTHPIMEEHCCLWDDNYPECPQRLTSIIQRCNELGLLDRCVKVEPREVTEQELEQLHSPLVLQMMRQTHQNQDVKLLEDVSSRFDAVFIHPTTHEAALLSAGGTIELVDRIVCGELQNGFALVRPPGHHAMHAEPCGYCVYNNVALAAQHALASGLTRVLLVDWDVHHGQATQRMFYDDPRVVYFSVHRYEHGSFWPNLRQSDFHYVGRGAGKGYNFNVPLNATGMGDADYLAIWYQLLLPMALEFAPELVLVSAGYDAAVGCPEGEMRVTPACYGWLTHLLMGVCSRVGVVLEGGYCLPSLAEGAAITLRTLLGHPPPPLPPHAPPCAQIVESILNCIYAHKPYWECYKHQPTYSVTSDVPNADAQGRDRHTVTVRWAGDETRPHRFLTRDCYPVQDEALRRDSLALLHHLKEGTENIPVTELPAARAVGWLYDARMLLHANPSEPDHVERPERVVRIRQQLEEFGLVARMVRLQARAATDAEILRVHSQEQLDQLKELSSLTPQQLEAKKKSLESVYFHSESLTSARYAVGSVLEGVEAVMSGAVGACVCVVRPPGHHCGRAPSGFCLLNSVAAAAAAASDAGRRVLLLDWDVHHGDGTQRLLYRDPNVLYISIHRYDNATFFPHSTAGDVGMVGEGPGEGFNINIPWNKRGMGDAEYLAALTQVVLPVGTEFRPDLVLVSAGFDACRGDPLGGCRVSPECFGRMSWLVRALAGGRAVLALEGGYNVAGTAHALTMCTKALLGDPLPPPPAPRAAVHPAARTTIHDVIKVHAKYWKSLRFQVALPEEDVLPTPEPSRGLLSAGDVDPAEAVLAQALDEMRAPSLEADLARMSLAGPSAPTPTLAAYLAGLEGEQAFAVVPLADCPHARLAAPLPAGLQLVPGTRCAHCQEDAEVWVCLQCFQAGCARGAAGHALAHHARAGHALALSLRDLSAWCYACDAYLHHAALHPATDNAHRNKFGQPAPWTYPSPPAH